MLNEARRFAVISDCYYQSKTSDQCGRNAVEVINEGYILMSSEEKKQ